MATEEKLNFDDISFDSMMDEGIETTTVSEDTVTAEEPKKETKNEKPAPPVEEVVSETPTTELDNDAEEKTEDVKEADEQEEDVEESLGDTEKEESPAPDTVVGEVLEKLGFTTETDYEDTAEGLVKMTQDVGQQLAHEQIEELLNRFPAVKDHLQYVVNGGESSSFMKAYDPRQDYEKLSINEKDANLQKIVLSNYFKMKGHDDEFIKDMVEDYEDGGKLFNKSKVAHKALVDAQKLERAEMLKQQQAEAKQMQKDEKEFWDGVYTTIDSSKEFSGIVVPQREKKKFFNYLITPVDKSGNTKRDLDHHNAPMETKLAIDYLMYKGFKLDDIIKAKAGTKKAKDLKSRIQKQTERVKNAKGAAKRKTGFDIDELDLSLGV